MKTLTLSPTRSGLFLFGAGLLGVVSLRLVHFPLDKLPPVVLTVYSPEELRWLMLVNPFILLLLGVLAGSLLHGRVGLTLARRADFRAGNLAGSLLRKGAVPGALAGLLILVVVQVFRRLIPEELARLGEDLAVPFVTKVLYGGVTEEILVRFGLMTLLVWLAQKAFRTAAAFTYWLGIAGAALLFGAGHLPMALLQVSSPSAALVAYLLLANSAAGLVFGWVYWRSGLAMAMVAHAVAHLALIIGDRLLF
ncbi:CPBP family glutamic-type intramembrane protease [Tellurirhabdus rosea]|uniref:CPBP family glutamic-type intramembrane protease n=1 Tax=Tellurirhabdus rosea TaxID=2674997 RepID=UPI00224D7F16|nr:CPBP family glutamic-type intramembrane protease [Tellurirhabdus rosea]